MCNSLRSWHGYCGELEAGGLRKSSDNSLAAFFGSSAAYFTCRPWPIAKDPADNTAAVSSRPGDGTKITRDIRMDTRRQERHQMAPLEDLPVRSAMSPRHQQQTRSRMLFPLLVACSLFVAAMFTSRALGLTGGRVTDTSTTERDSSVFVVHRGNPVDDVLFHTTDCANPKLAPVVQGVDLVGYFSLQPEEPAVAGRAEHAAVYEGYRYFFSSAENKALFEVGTELGIHKG